MRPLELLGEARNRGRWPALSSSKNLAAAGFYFVTTQPTIEQEPWLAETFE